MTEAVDGPIPAINIVYEERTPEEQSIFDKEVETLFKMAEAYEEVRPGPFDSVGPPPNRAQRRAMSKNSRKARRKSRG